MKITKSFLLYSTYWVGIICATWLCAIGRLDDDIYMLLIGIIIGHTISYYKNKESKNEKNN